MDVVKDSLAVLAGAIGLLTTILTMYAKYLDVKKSAAQDKETADAAIRAAVPQQNPAGLIQAEPPVEPTEWYTPPVSRYLPPAQTQDASTIARARALVRGPAITMIVVGSFSLFFNLIVGAYGFIDTFVVTLDTDSKVNQPPANLAAFQRGDMRVPSRMTGTDGERPDKATEVIGTFAMMGFSLASAVAIWGGIGMLRLKGYWVSVAGSFALMGGASFACCLTGFPVGGWSLFILFKPEVASSFR